MDRLTRALQGQEQGAKRPDLPWVRLEPSVPVVGRLGMREDWGWK